MLQMPRNPLSSAAVKTELDRVATALKKKGLAKPDRLDLVRRQAMLGDLRDGIAERARRAPR